MQDRQSCAWISAISYLNTKVSSFGRISSIFSIFLCACTVVFSIEQINYTEILWILLYFLLIYRLLTCRI